MTTENILRYFRLASDSQVQEGLAWYELAQEEAITIAKETGIELDKVIAIIAALSPRCFWTRNVKAAMAACKGEIDSFSGILGNSKNKAKALLNGATPQEVLTSPKIKAFYENIGGDYQPVTVDTWAIRAYHGDKGWFGTIREKEYRKIEQAYQEAARIVGLSPAQLQAVVWVVIRES